MILTRAAAAATASSSPWSPAEAWSSPRRSARAPATPAGSARTVSKQAILRSKQAILRSKQAVVRSKQAILRHLRRRREARERGRAQRGGRRPERAHRWRLVRDGGGKGDIGAIRGGALREGHARQLRLRDKRAQRLVYAMSVGGALLVGRVTRGSGHAVHT